MSNIDNDRANFQDDDPGQGRDEIAVRLWIGALLLVVLLAVTVLVLTQTT